MNLKTNILNKNQIIYTHSMTANFSNCLFQQLLFLIIYLYLIAGIKSVKTILIHFATPGNQFAASTRSYYKFKKKDENNYPRNLIIEVMPRQIQSASNNNYHYVTTCSRVNIQAMLLYIQLFQLHIDSKLNHLLQYYLVQYL